MIDRKNKVSMGFMNHDCNNCPLSTSAVITQDAKEVDVSQVDGVCGTNYCPGAAFPTLNNTGSGADGDDSVISTSR